MDRKELKEFIYLEKEDYDSKVKINEENLKVYSKNKLKKLFPENDYAVIGETFEKKKRNREKDIGRIELNEKRLYVGKSGEHNKLLKKQAAFVEITDGGFIALLKLRMLPVILIFLLILGCTCGALCCTLRNNNDPGGNNNDPGIKKIETEILTISGKVYKDGKSIEAASISLKNGDAEIQKATTDSEGNYLLCDVKNGNYNLVCTYEESVLTKIAVIDGKSLVINFRFPADDLHDVEDITDHHDKEDLPESKPTDENSDVKAIVKVPDGTPAIAVGGLDAEAILNMIAGKEVDLTLLAEKIDESKVPSEDKAAISGISGELELTYFDFSLLKEIFSNKVLESAEYLKNTKTVLEIAVTYDSSMDAGTYVFRYHDGKAIRFDELADKPEKDFKDGTCYITADTVYVYTNCFSTYSIGSAYVGHVVKGSDTLTYSDKATIDLKTGKIDMLYRHESDSTSDARIEIYLVGENSNLLVAQSGIIPIGYEISEMKLLSGISNMPSVGTYNGLMKIVYLGVDGNTNTNVDIPLSVAIKQ